VRNSRAVFGHADYKLFDPLTVNLGARHSWDYVDHGYSCATPASCNALGNAPVPLDYFQHARFQNNSFEAGLQYKIERDKMAYFRFAQGYRGGGFLGLPSSVDAAAVIIKPETSNSYELGAKTDWLDGRQQLNLTLFNVKFKNMQRDIVLAGPNNTFIQATANAADATTRGVELESISKPVKALTVRTNVGYLDAHYTRYNSLDSVTGKTLDLSGQPLTYAPKWTASLIPEYRIPLGTPLLGFESVNLRSNMTYRSSYTTSSVNNPIGHQGGFMMVDASLALEAGSYSVTGYVNNLTNKHYLVLGETVSGLIYHAIDNIDRTYGVTVAMRF
jgi:iron complex outermembrane receptor protein